MAAPAAVALSSSPPRIFARSPTAVDSSPSLPSPAEIFARTPDHGRRLQPSKKTRDGFAHGFSTGSSLLRAKKTAENVPIRSPGRERFKCSENGKDQCSSRFVFESGSPRATPRVAEARTVTSKDTAAQEPSLTRVEVTGPSPRVASSVQREIATPRRTDWTPPNESSRSLVDLTSSPCLDRAQTFPDDLLQNFGFLGSDPEDDVTRPPAVATNKGRSRQRIEPLTGVGESVLAKPKKSEKTKTKGSNKPISQRRSKAPAKKSMTITKLSTALYTGRKDDENASPMMQFLNPTQARDLYDNDDVQHLVSDEPIAKETKRKPNTSKGCTQKAKVVSPHSAIKAMEAQSTVFGSASQLARDDQAVPPPQIDPFPTQHTQPISIESTTPRSGQGTSKFVRKRNLWSVSARDEDNALLYVDSVDLFDTPDMRAAFAGKDVLLESNFRKARPQPSRVGNDSPIDIAAFESPLLREQSPRPVPFASRSFHTSARVMSPTKAINKNKVSSQTTNEGNSKNVQEAGISTEKPVTNKPSYAGFSTFDLQKQISSFGFKPVKKREKMIELLEQCWEAKQDKSRVSIEHDQALKHGDFLSNVHDVSSRPELKVKKPRKRAKAEQGEASPKKTPKRQRNSASSEQQEGGQKKVRKKTSQTRNPSKADVAVKGEVDSAKLGVSVSAIDPSDHAFLAPVPHLPLAPNKLNKAERNDELEQAETDLVSIEANTPPVSSVTGHIGEKIHAAIMRQSDDSTVGSVDHLTNPTWHDKILQYDPVILEDLTTWLNTEGLGLVNEDGEVSATQVREWCEINGICCLWKGGWRGQKVKGAED